MATAKETLARVKQFQEATAQANQALVAGVSADNTVSANLDAAVAFETTISTEAEALADFFNPPTSPSVPAALS